MDGPDLPVVGGRFGNRFAVDLLVSLWPCQRLEWLRVGADSDGSRGHAARLQALGGGGVGGGSDPIALGELRTESDERGALAAVPVTAVTAWALRIGLRYRHRGPSAPPDSRLGRGLTRSLGLGGTP